MGSLGDSGGKELILNTSSPILIELTRLENLLRDKERELAAAQNENKALKGSEFLKDKAVLELSSGLRKFEQKLESAEKQIEDKNLEIKKLIGEKKAALSAQFAAEATLRRIHANPKEEDDAVSVGTLTAPLEAEIKMYKNEISALQEDRKASSRLLKSKELALVEAEKNLNAALERALMVENLQNQNLELKKRVEICLEENKFQEKINHQKVIEVEKLSQTIQELEECILVGGKAANAVRDYQRQVAELNEVRKTLERELAKTKISANRVATVVANEWKDEGDKVMPVKQWLEERKFLQGEIQRLKDKLVISERSAKAESQLKDKFKLRLRTLEDCFKQVTASSTIKTTNSDQNIIFSSSNNAQQKRSMSQPRATFASASKLSVKQQSNSATRSADSAKTLLRSNSLKGNFISSENVIRKNLRTSRSKFYDESGKENVAKRNNVDDHEHVGDSIPQENDDSEVTTNEHHNIESNTENQQDLCEDFVSGFLYDRLQKEVIILRKLQEEKDEMLNVKDDDIKLLKRKVDALTKAMEVETKIMRRAVAAREKEALQKSEDNKQKIRTANMIRRTLKL
ncbi:microtubule-associated protein 70-5 [Dendrobium catenatum]|uniref:Microtubule-associated protein 70-2 n=1 Tax=Dendrobium catenatum TaxID=906689 RepID=A0A2I0XA28_9ASPA|nr:microtubule-associated protein 70-5 [Dendrobium catenatum]PKU84778.1 Microtubule-associated protein 70-2 [Dendrobium catenatum]